MSCTIVRDVEGKIVDVKVYEGESKQELIINKLLSTLKRTGLASDVIVMDSEGIKSKLSITNLHLKDVGDVTGFIHNNIVYLNSDNMTLDTPIHEFGHLWVDFIKTHNFELYSIGRDLVNEYGKNIIDKLSKDRPELKGNMLIDEVLAEMIGTNGAEMVAKSNTKSWIKQLWEYIKDILGISSKNIDDIINMTLDDFTKSTAYDLIKGTHKANFTTPYTISPLMDKMIQNKKGKLVSVQTIKQILNQSSTKAIEKDIIMETLDMPMFKGKNKIDFSLFESEVNKKIIPLEIIKSKSHSDYGSGNVGVDIDDDFTNIYNSHLEHGNTGHFSGDFPDIKIVNSADNVVIRDKSYDFTVRPDDFEKTTFEGDDNIYFNDGIFLLKLKSNGNYDLLDFKSRNIISKDLDYIEQLDDYSIDFDYKKLSNEIVEAGYIKVFYKERVGEPSTNSYITLNKTDEELKKEIFTNRLSDYEDVLYLEVRELNGQYAVVKSNVILTQDNIQDNVLTVTSSREKAEDYINKILDKENTNRGLFGHTRVWTDIDDEGNHNAYVVELQSDSFQKAKAEEMLFKSYETNPRLMTKKQSEIMVKIDNAQDIIKSTDKQIKNLYKYVSDKYSEKNEIEREIKGLQHTLDSLPTINKLTKERNVLGDKLRDKLKGKTNEEKDEIINSNEYKELNKKYLDLGKKLNKLPKIGNIVGEPHKVLESKIKHAKGALEDINSNIKKELTLLKKDISLEDMYSYNTPKGIRTDLPNDFFIISINSNNFMLSSSSSGSLGIFETIDEAFKVYEVDYHKQINSTDYEKYYQAVKDFPKLKSELFKNMSLKDKQFVAHRKNYTTRLLREEIRRNAINGMKTLSIPTPRTLALIENYIKDDGNSPYEIINANDEERLDFGDEIEYLGDDYTVVDSTSSDITIIKTSELTEINEDDFLDEIAEQSTLEDIRQFEDLYSNNFITEEDWDELLLNDNLPYSIKEGNIEFDDITSVMGDDFELHLYKLEEKIKQYYLDEVYTDAESQLSDYEYSNIYTDGDGTLYYTTNNVYPETLNQPDQYDSANIEEFDIGDMSSSEQTVLNKYKDLVDIFNKERNGNVEKIKDSKGNEWIRTTLTENDAIQPVVSFQKKSKSSKLYNDISKNVFIGKNKGLEIYKNIFSKKFIKDFGNINTDLKGKKIVYRAGELSREDGKFGNAIYFAENFNQALDFGNPSSYILDMSKVKDYGKQIDFVKAVASFNKVSPSKITQKHKDAFIQYNFDNDIIPSFTLLEGNREFLLSDDKYIEETYNYHKIDKNGEPKLYYKTKNNNAYTTYKEALNNSKGGKISVGFIGTNDILTTKNSNLINIANNDVVSNMESVKINTPDAFIQVADIDSSSSNSTLNGFVNEAIKQNILSDSKVEIDGKYYFKGEGNQDIDKIYNSHLVRQKAVEDLGLNNIKWYGDGTLELFDIDNTIELTDNTGNKVKLPIKDIESLLKKNKFKELSSKYIDITSVAYKLFADNNNLFGQETLKSQITKKEEKDLRLTLMNTLTDLGISVVSMVNYNEKYNIKNGNDPSIEALADISEQVIAFAEGKDTIDNITEETAHFIIEGYDNQDEIDGILGEVVNTKEWSEFNNIYYEKYSDSYKGIELDNIVKREILGKVLARKIKDSSVSNGTDSLYSKLIKIFNKFVQRVKAFLTGNHINNLNLVLDKIAERVVDNTITEFINTNNFSTNNNVLYSLSNKAVISKITALKNKMESRLKVLRATKDINSGRVKQEIENIINAINNADENGAIQIIIGSVNREVKSIKKQLESFKEKSDDDIAWFSPADAQSFNSIVNNFLPMLEGLREVIKDNITPVGVNSVNDIINDINSLVSEISIVKGLKEEQGKKDFEAIYNRIVDLYNLPPSEKEKVMKLLDADIKEIGWFQRKFGSLEHTNSIHLGVLGKIIMDNNTKSRFKFINKIHKLTKIIKDKNIRVSDWENMTEKDAKGNLSNFLLSPYKWTKFYDEELKAKTDAYNKVFNESIDKDKYKELLKNNSIEFTVEQEDQFNEIMSEWYLDNTEKMFTKEFYVNTKEKYKRLDISKKTQSILSNHSIDRARILAKYRDNYGNVDYYKISDRDLLQLDDISQSRKSYKSVIDAMTGELKTGINLRIAEDLQKLDEEYQKEGIKDFNTKSEFYETLARIEKDKGRAEAFKWLNKNGNITFNSKFWDEFKDKDGVIDKLKTSLGSIEDIEEKGKVEDLINRLESLMDKKKEILKQYQVSNKPSEVYFENMYKKTLNIIKDLQSDIQDTLSMVYKYLPDSNDDNIIDTESTVNDSYIKALRDSTLKEIDFIKEHTTDRDKLNIISIENNLEQIKQGGYSINKNTKLFMERYTNMEYIDIEDIKNILKNKEVSDIVAEYGRTKLLPYFKRFAPKGYKEFIDNINNGNESIVDLVHRINNDNVEGVEKYLEIRPNFSWMGDEANSKYINKNYDKSRETGRFQPKISKYINDGFFTYMGLSKSDFLNSNILNGGNNNYEIYKELLNVKRMGLEVMGEIGNENIYKVVQQSKKTSEKYSNILKNPLTTVKNTINDMLYTRVDTKEFGEDIDGENIKDLDDSRIIPKYYLNDLEELSDVARDYGASFSNFLHSALETQTKEDTVAEAMVVLEALKDKAKQVGLDDEKAGINMFKDFIDAYFYGIKRTRPTYFRILGKKFDISKIIIGFDKFVRTMNIGFSLPIALTSYTSGKVFGTIENIVGQHTHMHSAKWASKEWLKLTPDFIKDIGEVNKDSKMARLAEKFNVFEVSGRIESAGFNKIVRAGNSLPYKFSQIANYPITPKIMLSILDDFRLVEGKFTTFSDFRKVTEFENKKDLLEKWQAHQHNSLYNLLDVTEESVDFKDSIKKSMDDKYLESQLLRVTGLITSVNSKVDSLVPLEDKSAASRDFLMRFMTAHRGWLSIGLQNRLKGEHFNLKTGQIEKGHYRSLSNLVSQAFKFGEEKNISAIINSIKENYETLDEVDKLNLKRVFVDLSTYMFLVGIGLIVAGVADDDDNKDIWAIQMSSYIYFRTVNEVGSNQAVPGAKGLLDIIESPFIAINSLRSLTTGSNYSLNKVKSGAYKNDTKLYKTLIKQTYIRHFYTLGDIKKTSDYYRHLNSETLIGLDKKRKDKNVK